MALHKAITTPTTCIEREGGILTPRVIKFYSKLREEISKNNIKLRENFRKALQRKNHSKEMIFTMSI